MEINLFSQDSKLSQSHQALIKNTIATGVSVFILFNAEVAIICMVANAALSLLAENKDKITSWLKWDHREIQHLKNYWKNSPPFFIINIVRLVVVKLFFIVQASKTQTVIVRLIQSFANPAYAAWLIFRICIVAPVIEEVIFRGFLQEKIRNIQVLALGSTRIDSKIQQVVRIAFQAIVFGLIHVRPEQGALNGFIFLFTGAIGAVCGNLKEKTSTLWVPMAFHAHNNISYTLYVVGDHFIPPLHRPPIPQTAAPAA